MPVDVGKIIPRLQAFYGGNPQSWLALPRVWLDCFVQMLPALRAERLLELIQSVMLGQIPQSKDMASVIDDSIRELERQATQFEEVSNSGKSVKDIAFELIQMGLPVTITTANPQENLE